MLRTEGYKIGERVVILHCEIKTTEHPQHDLCEHHGVVESVCENDAVVLLDGSKNTRYRAIGVCGKPYESMVDDGDNGFIHNIILPHLEEKLSEARLIMCGRIESIRDAHDGVSSNLRNKLGLLGTQPLPVSLSDIGLATILATCATIKPATNLTVMISEDTPDTQLTTKSLMAEVDRQLRAQGYEAMAERFTAVADGLQSLYPLIILAAGFVFIEEYSKREISDEVGQGDDKRDEIVIETKESDFIDKNGKRRGRYRIGDHYFLSRLNAIEASRAMAPDHAPIFSVLTKGGKAHYTVDACGTRAFHELQNAMYFARQVKDILTKEELKQSVRF